ncbi:MAG TPA: oxygenase MpaB family protein [Solirubrobacteraceae bacterium]|nr:oxygenase MpaB family protein [Solirubrobacteraceae bacterium]
MNVTPHEDYGFFGPDSVTWKVWTYPTSVTIGFQRSVVIEELDPNLIAAVDATGDIFTRPRTRYDRTLRYFAMISLGDSRSATTASNMLVKVHAKAVGIDPLLGTPYDANNPHSQLWIHLTAWHSILYAYERYGPGKLTRAEEDSYWEECAVAAELQTCDPADVPRSREGIRAYFESMRPKLAGSEAAQRAMDHLLNAKVMMPPVPWPARPLNWVVNEVHRRATIATMPRWMRKMAGIHQSRATDVLVTPVMRIALKLGASNPRLMLATLELLSPGTVPIAAPVLLGIPPRNPVTLTPAQARERYGVLPPREEYARFRAHVDSLTAAKRAVVVGPQIDESVEILGAVA